MDKSSRREPNALTGIVEWSPSHVEGLHSSLDQMNAQNPTALPSRFAHPAERALAELFDRHGIRWTYEPHLFEIELDGDGRTRSGFRPDFFLPDLDIYVECTMMKQSLTTRKNRKARAAAAKHGIVVVVFYRRDFERLSAEHGLRLDEAA